MMAQQSGIADHATGAGVAQAMQARAMLKVGPYVQASAPQSGSLVWIRQGDKVPTPCGCESEHCRADSLWADCEATARLPGQEADIQHDLAFAAYTINAAACRGDNVPTQLVLGLPAATRTELCSLRAYSRRVDDYDRRRNWAADDR